MNYVGLHLKHLLFLSDFNKTWIFWADFGKYSDIMKIREVGAEMFHVDGRTDKHDKGNIRFP